MGNAKSLSPFFCAIKIMNKAIVHFFFVVEEETEPKKKPKNVLARRPAVAFSEHSMQLASLRQHSVLCSENPASSKDLLVRNVFEFKRTE